MVLVTIHRTTPIFCLYIIKIIQSCGMCVYIKTRSSCRLLVVQLDSLVGTDYHPLPIQFGFVKVNGTKWQWKSYSRNRMLMTWFLQFQGLAHSRMNGCNSSMGKLLMSCMIMMNPARKVHIKLLACWNQMSSLSDLCIGIKQRKLAMMFVII